MTNNINQDTDMTINPETETETETTETKQNESLKTITENLGIVKEHLKELETMTNQLERRVQLARGTRDVSKQAAAVTRPADPLSMVEQVLRGNSMSISQVSKQTALSASRVSEIIKRLRSERRVANVGTEDYPKWTLRIGDNASPRELNAEVKRLISDRPMTTNELIDITGARLSRVSGALVALQRTEDSLLNLGSARRARWFLVNDKAVVAKLAPKGG